MKTNKVNPELHKRIKAYVRGRYYVDRSTVWEPFEGYGRPALEQLIKLDLEALVKVLNG